MSTNMQTLPIISNYLLQDKTQIPKIRRKLTFIDQLHIYGVFILQVLVFSILISFILWLFIRLPEPEVFVTGFEVDGLRDDKTSSTMLHYNITLHNPDIYKSIKYDVLVMRITYSEYYKQYCGVVNFIPDGKPIYQGPRKTRTFDKLSIDYTSDGMIWDRDTIIPGLKTAKEHISLRFVMEMRTMGFARQRMRIARIYFNDSGDAFINKRGGLNFDS